MSVASAPPTTLFVAVIAVALHVAWASRRASAGAGWMAASAVAYLVVPAALPYSGALDRYAPLPAPPLVLIPLLGVLTLALSPIGARVASSLGPAALVGFQAFRVPEEWLLHRLHHEGVVPVEMTRSGRNFDVSSGVTAALLALWLMRRGVPFRRLVATWNLLAPVLLANIVVVAVLSAPAPFRRFTDGPPHLLPNAFPHVWIPSFLVQVALAGHVPVFRRLTAGVTR